jgi:putative peptidoglycan binding protein
MKRIALVLIVGLSATVAQGDEFDIVDYGIFRSLDPLAQRDEWGTTHQTPNVNATDFAPRYNWRWRYYFKARQQLLLDPAYVGSLQTALRRLGYYCGPVDGVFTPEVSYAIARLQKSYSMRVTGNLDNPVRRALHMP